MSDREATAMVLEAPGVLSAHELPLPDIGEDDGLLRVEACGLCGTDHEQFDGTLPVDGPFIPGHESVGVIDQVGEKAAERWGVSVGDRVVVEVFQSCRSCDRCAAGDYRRCRRHGRADMYGFVPVSTEPALWGGYATHQYLAPDSLLLAVPDGLDPVTATLFNPLGAGIRWGVTLPGTSPGDSVAVLGPGLRGLSVLVAAKDAGAGFVMVTGRGERDHQRLEWATKLGADLVVDVDTADPRSAFRTASGTSGPDVVVDVTARAPAALSQAVGLARSGGTVILAGMRGPSGAADFDPDRVVLKELRLLGALGVDTGSYRAALDLLASSRFPIADVPSTTVGLDGVADLLRAMAGQTDLPPPIRGVVVPAPIRHTPT